MKIRPLRPSDLELLHQLYLSLVSVLPHHPLVGLEQFSEELTQTRWQEDEAWLPGGSIALVAEKAGVPLAFAHGSILDEDAHYSSLKAGMGVLRFVMAGPQESDACRAVIGAVVEEAKAHGCRRLVMGSYGPLFHNYGSSALSNAWPWIGRCLLQEGFYQDGYPALAMYRTLDAPLPRIPPPNGAELRYDWVTRLGERDEWEGGYHIFFGQDRAAETMLHYGEKYMRGAGKSAMYLFWMGTNDPYRGRGLGRLLLRETLATAQEAGARETCLRTGMENFYALSIYRAEGYEPNDILWRFKYEPTR